MNSKELNTLVVAALEDGKAQNIISIDVTQLTGIADTMVFCSGTSSRHVKALADNVVTKAKEKDTRAIGVEGENEGEWVLVDLGDVIIHIMQPTIREYYQLEKLWDIKASTASSS